MEYRVRLYIPSKKKFDYLDEIKNKNIIAISKFIQANDEYGLSSYFEKLLSSLELDNIIDKFCVLLQLRGLNFNGKAVLKGKHADGNEVEYKIDIFEFVGQLLEGLESVPDQYEFITGEYKFLFKLPTRMYFKNTYALLYDTLLDIEYNGVSVYKGLQKKEKFNYVIGIDKETITNVVKFFNQTNNNSEIFFIKNDDKDILLPSIRVSFFNNTIFNTLKALFKIELTYIYNKFYVCLTKLGISYTDYLNLSFIEADILLSIYKSANNLK